MRLISSAVSACTELYIKCKTNNSTKRLVSLYVSDPKKTAIIVNILNIKISQNEKRMAHKDLPKALHCAIRNIGNNLHGWNEAIKKMNALNEASNNSIQKSEKKIAEISGTIEKFEKKRKTVENNINPDQEIADNAAEKLDKVDVKALIDSLTSEEDNITDAGLNLLKIERDRLVNEKIFLEGSIDKNQNTEKEFLSYIKMQRMKRKK